MCDIVKDETERIDSRFLEPACGDGNFLAEILMRKLIVVRKKYAKSHLDYEKNAVLTASSIYGVDILQDNVIACRERMFGIWDKEYTAVCNGNITAMSERPLLENGTEVFIRYNEMISIIRKVVSFNESSFANIVSPRNPYAFRSDFIETSILLVMNAAKNTFSIPQKAFGNGN